LKLVGRVARAEVERDGLVRLEYPPFDVVVALVAGVPHAIEDACNHAGASLAEGFVSDCRVTCPMHGYVFDVRTGELLVPKGLCGDQRAFVARLEGEDIVVYDPVQIRIV
jgi:nitrite reductase/ring-hydroxylating ferredoxin subunit